MKKKHPDDGAIMMGFLMASLAYAAIVCAIGAIGLILSFLF